MVNSFKIGIDYHGVIDANPSFFKVFNQKAIKKGDKIYVLSGGGKEDVQAYLQQNQIPYTHIFSLLDYFRQKNLVTFFDGGRFFVESNLWDKAKAEYCFNEHIDIHIDDSPLYGQYFRTPFCLYELKSNQCCDLKNNISIDFNCSADAVLESLHEKLNLRRQTPLVDEHKVLKQVF